MILTFRSLAYKGGSYSKVGGVYATAFTAVAGADPIPPVNTFRRAHRIGAYSTPYTGRTNYQPENPSGNF